MVMVKAESKMIRGEALKVLLRSTLQQMASNTPSIYMGHRITLTPN